MELQRDCNAVINVDGLLTYWQSVQQGGGEMVEYPATPVGGPPAINFCEDTRSSYEWTIETNIPGADQTVRNAFINKFAVGTIFTVAASAAGSGEMSITGESASIGTKYFIASRQISHSFQENSKLTIALKEKGGSDAGTGSGT